MSAVQVRAALETALAAMTPALVTAWENQGFTPPTIATPYQRVNVLLAEPSNVEMSPSYEERGFMQAMLCYPTGLGTAAVAARAQAIRSAFPRGRSMVAGGTTTTVRSTPEIMPGFVDGDRFCIPVRIPFRAQVNV